MQDLEGEQGRPERGAEEDGEAGSHAGDGHDPGSRRVEVEPIGRP